MTENGFPKPITLTQVVGILVLALVIFFIIAFASKAVHTYRLRAWRDELQAEIAAMDREREVLRLEIKRRESDAWIDEALKETGRIPPDALAVRLVTPPVPQPMVTPQPAERRAADAASLSNKIKGLGLFENPNWKAWMRLIWDRDR